jgi:heme/copper-type cytochrome/quinol oxidase subunit 3
MGMALWLFTELMFFAALISAFFVARSTSIAWPPLGQPRIPVLLTGINTVVLLASAWFIWTAAFGHASGRDKNRDRAGYRTALMLGSVFVSIQGFEWVRLLGFGLALTSGAYGGFFYLIIGAHAIHALAGLVALALSLPAVSRDGGRVGQAVALYWLFVVALWPLLYGLVYLL